MKFFEDQRKALLRWLKTEHKDISQFGVDPFILLECKLFPPHHFPHFDKLGLGTKELVKRVRPTLLTIWQAAGTSTMSRIRTLRARHRHKLHSKAIDTAFDVSNPAIAEAIDQATFKFSDSTNATTSMQLDQALQELRDALTQNIESGTTLPKLTAMVQSIFDTASKSRAQRIAATEASRAQHQAQLIAAKESGVVTGMEWLASEDACPLCQTIARRARFIPLGKNFAVIGDDPAYQDIDTPPAHPLCQCSLIECLDTDGQPDWSDTLDNPEPEAEDYPEGEAPDDLVSDEAASDEVDDAVDSLPEDSSTPTDESDGEDPDSLPDDIGVTDEMADASEPTVTSHEPSDWPDHWDWPLDPLGQEPEAWPSNWPWPITENATKPTNWPATWPWPPTETKDAGNWLKIKMNECHDPSSGQFCSTDGGSGSSDHPVSEYAEHSNEDIVDEVVMPSVPYESWQDQAPEIDEWRDKAVNEISEIRDGKAEDLKDQMTTQKGERKELASQQKEDVADLKYEYRAAAFKEFARSEADTMMDNLRDQRIAYLLDHPEATTAEKNEMIQRDMDKVDAFKEKLKVDWKAEYEAAKEKLAQEHEKQKGDLVAKQREETFGLAASWDKDLHDKVNELKADFANLVDDLRSEYLDE